MPTPTLTAVLWKWRSMWSLKHSNPHHLPPCLPYFLEVSKSPKAHLLQCGTEQNFLEESEIQFLGNKCLRPQRVKRLPTPGLPRFLRGFTGHHPFYLNQLPAPPERSIQPSFSLLQSHLLETTFPSIPCS